jgi:hypothetical protein
MYTRAAVRNALDFALMNFCSSTLQKSPWVGLHWQSRSTSAAHQKLVMAMFVQQQQALVATHG